MKASEVKRGNVVEHDGKAYQIRDIERSSPQGRSGNVTFRFSMYTLDANVVGDASGYISEGIEGCFIQLIDDAPVALQLPQSVTLEVVETAPDMKGATATKRPKPAKLNTGIEIQVPEYIGNGEKIIVNTVTGEFAGRA